MNHKSTVSGLRKKAPLFTIVGGVVLINPVYAQNPPAPELEEIVVTGMRVSMRQSMEIKRDSIGVVDAITAEDIGRFPAPTSPNHCSASRAWRSIARTAKARR